MNFGLEGYIPWTLYLGSIVCFLVAASGRPFVGLCYLILLAPLQTIRYKLHGMPLGNQFVDLMFLSMIIGLKVRGERIFPRTPLNALLACFTVYTYLSLWRGVLTVDAGLPLWFDNQRLSDWKNFMVILLLFMQVVAVVKTRRQMKILILIMCVSVLLLDKGYRSNIVDRDFSAFSYDIRSDGAMGYAGVNGLAAFEAQFCSFLLALSFFEKNWALKFGYLAILSFSVYVLMFALSRGGYAAFLIGVLFLGLVKKRSLLLVLFVFLLVWEAVVPPAVSQRVMGTVQGGEVESSAAERLTLWEDAMQVFKGDPLFGTGFNTYAYMGRVGPYRDTHNLYVKVLVETGLLGLALFLFMLFAMFRTAWTLYATASDDFLVSLGLGASVWMVCVVVANLFGDRWTYFQITGFTWAVLGMAVRGQMITDEERDSQGTEQAAPEQLAAAEG